MTTSLSHIPEQYRPIGEIFSLVGEKWTVAVVAHLGKGKMRFNELRREINGISQKMLAATLRGLERDGFVSRTMFPVIPPRVEYELTDLGMRLLEPIKGLGKFALDNKVEVEAARARFDADMPVVHLDTTASMLPMTDTADFDLCATEQASQL